MLGPYCLDFSDRLFLASAPESDRRDLLSELEVMKTLKPHPHVIRLLGCVTETGKIFEVLMNKIVHTFVELDSLPPNFLYYSLYYRKTPFS